MIIKGGDALLVEVVARLAGSLAVAGIDDGAARHGAEDVKQFGKLVGGLAHHITEVGSRETHLIHLESLHRLAPCGRGTRHNGARFGPSQVGTNIAHHLGRGRSGQRQHGHAWQQLAYLRYLQIGRAEVVAPLRDAVGLVHGQEADLHLAQLHLEYLGGQTLGRNVKEFVRAKDGVVQMAQHFVTALARIDGCCRDAARAEVGHLVLHQRNERRDHNANALQGQCGHLEGDTLATTRRHEAQGVVASQHTLDNLLLDAAKLLVAPISAKDVKGRGRGMGRAGVGSAGHIFCQRRWMCCQGVRILREGADYSQGRMSSICNWMSPRLWLFSSMA